MTEITQLPLWLDLLAIAGAITAIGGAVKPIRSAVVATFKAILYVAKAREAWSKYMEITESVTALHEEIKGDGNGRLSLRDFVARELEPLRGEIHALHTKADSIDERAELRWAALDDLVSKVDRLLERE